MKFRIAILTVLTGMLATVALADTITLPHATGISDSAGNQWVIFQQGYLQQQGNMPAFSQGARLQINGTYVRLRDNTVRTDDKTGEILLENLQAGSIGLTRRILVDKEGQYVRYAEVLTNAADTEATVTISLNSAFNFGTISSNAIGDGEDKKMPVAGIAVLHNQRAAIQVLAGRGGNLRPKVLINAGGGNSIGGTAQLTVPPNGTSVFIHLYATAAPDAAEKFVLDLRDTDILRTLPSELRSKVVNFGGAMFFSDVELLRGDAFDVVELRSGDQLRGTLEQQQYVLETFYGTIELATDRVVALVNVGGFRPRQLLATRDGEIFGGHLQGDTLPLSLSSGQTLQIPLSQIARAGYRIRPNEPQGQSPAWPMAYMIAGDRMLVQPPTAPIALVTRYGTLSLPPETVAAIDFVNEDQPVHQVYLRDGSRFAAVVSAPQLELTLSESARNQVVRFATSSLRRLQLDEIVDEPARDSASLVMVNQDRLVGKIVGALQLDTTFDTINLNAPEIAGLARQEEGSDVQVTLWDGTSMTGRLHQETLEVQLASGVTVAVPVPLVQSYIQPLPQPPASMLQRVQAIVERLSAEEWKQRDAAQEELTKLGAPVIPALKQLRPDQSPEAQQRIDQIINTLEKASRK